MSLITRCPACGTMFKVVPDQLKISEGWVRCGHCTEIFDASANLQADDVSSLGSSAIKVDSQPQAAGDVFSETESFASSLITEFGEAVPSQAPDSADLDAQAKALAEDPLDQPFALRREDIAQPEDLHVVAPPLTPAASTSKSKLDAQREPQPELEPEPEVHDLNFVRQARRKAFWSQPMVRAIMLLALVALGLLLLAQFAVQERDRLAAADPALRPLLSKLCEPLNCSVRAPRQIDAISIDSSSFSKLRGDAYRLNLTLKNQAAMEVAMPALELTLTDGQDQALMRRVLMPAELGSNAGVIAATSEWSGSLALGVANGNGGRIAGYRLLAFYP